MTLSIEEVTRIAHLARLSLTGEELALYSRQLSAVLAYAERLEGVDIEHVAPTSSAVPLNNVMREDAVEPSLTIDEALFNAARVAGREFQILPVLDV
jgi:aspartyl-tRNA(Asn)/glutamyl-tRNA(Gln) amidotransferase subunit C